MTGKNTTELTRKGTPTSSFKVRHINIKMIFIIIYSSFVNRGEIKGTEIRILRNSKILNLGCIFII